VRLGGIPRDIWNSSSYAKDVWFLNSSIMLNVKKKDRQLLRQLIGMHIEKVGNNVPSSIY